MDVERAGWIREKEALQQQIALLQKRLDEENTGRRKANAILRRERKRVAAGEKVEKTRDSHTKTVDAKKKRAMRPKSASHLKSLRASGASASLSNLGRSRGPKPPKSAQKKPLVELPKQLRFLPRPLSKGTSETERLENYRLVHYPEYSRLGVGETCVVIARCSQCSRHQMTTRHDEKVYIMHANKVAAAISSSMPSVRIIHKLVGIRQPGSLEVQVCMRHDRRLEKRLLHSKIITGRWPSPSQVVQNLRAIVLNLQKRVEVEVRATLQLADEQDIEKIFDGCLVSIENTENGEHISSHALSEDVQTDGAGSVSAVVSLVAPSGKCTLRILGGERFIEAREQIDTREHVVTRVTRTLCEKRSFHVVVRSESVPVAGLVCSITDRNTGSTLSEMTGDNGIAVFAVGPLAQQGEDGSWPSHGGFTRSITIGIRDDARDISVDSQPDEPEVKDFDVSTFHFDL
eukprot:g142.t1